MGNIYFRSSDTTGPMFMFGLFWQIVILVLFYRFWGLKAFSQDVQLYYEYPNQPINNPNVTIAAMFKLTEGQTKDDIESAANIMTLLCEVERYNSGRGEFDVNGIFNVLVVPTKEKDNFSSWVLTRQILGQNLYFTNTTTTFGAIQNTPINALIRLASLRELSAETPIIAGVSFPAIDFVSERKYSKESNTPIIVTSPSSYAGSVSVSEASPQIVANYITQILLHYNWSLVGAIFSSDITGFYGQNSLQDWVYTNFRNNLTFSCLGVVDRPNSATFKTDLEDFSNCIFTSNNIRAVVVWMNSGESIIATQEILKDVGTSSNLVFIYPGLTDEAATTTATVSSMFLRPNLENSLVGANFECAQSSKQQMIRVLGKETVDMVSINYGNCIVTDPSLPICDEIRSDNNFNCTCLSDEIVSHPDN